MTAYEQKERQGLGDKPLTEENAQLKRHIYEQELKIGELEVNHTQIIEIISYLLSANTACKVLY